MVWALSFQEEAMARTRTEQVQPQHIATIDEIDEALWWTSHQRERNQHWRRWVDSLLDERNRLAATTNRPRA